MPKGWDVIVIGGGLWGLACAYAMAKRNLSVAVFEAGKIGQGASGGIVGAMSPHVPDSWSVKKQFQFEALATAHLFWTEVEDISGMTSGYGRIGRIMPLRSERERALSQERAKCAQDVWQGMFDWQTLDHHPMIPDRIAPFGVSYDTLSARLSPIHALEALKHACLSRNVEIIENRKVTDITDHSISGDWGKAAAQSIILAAGTDGFSLLDPHIGQGSGFGVKGQAALLACDLGDAPQIFAKGVYVVPHANGTTAVGSTVEPEWNDPDTTDEKLDDVIKVAQSIVPALKDAPVLKRWAHLRPKARRRHPMLGPVPGLNGVYTAMGAYTIGFGLAHKVGEILADCVDGCDPDIPDHFSVEWHME